MSVTPSPVTNCHTFSDPSPLERDILHGRPLGRGQPGTGSGGVKIVVMLLLELVGTGRGVVKIVGVILRGGEEGRGRRSWVVVKAQATPGIPASV